MQDADAGGQRVADFTHCTRPRLGGGAGDFVIAATLVAEPSDGRAHVLTCCSAGAQRVKVDLDLVTLEKEPGERETVRVSWERSAPVISRRQAAQEWAAVFAVSGVILGAVYMLWMVKRVFFGEKGPLITDTHAAHGLDIGAREIAVLVPFIILIFWMGIFCNRGCRRNCK